MGHIADVTIVPTAQSRDALRPWDAMTAQEKTDAIERLIRRAIDRAMPELLTAE